MACDLTSQSAHENCVETQETIPFSTTQVIRSLKKMACYSNWFNIHVHYVWVQYTGETFTPLNRVMTHTALPSFHIILHSKHHRNSWYLTFVSTCDMYGVNPLWANPLKVPSGRILDYAVAGGSEADKGASRWGPCWRSRTSPTRALFKVRVTNTTTPFPHLLCAKDLSCWMTYLMDVSHTSLFDFLLHWVINYGGYDQKRCVCSPQ